MKKNVSFEHPIPPTIIGGIGGSGTRLIANCLEELDFFIGHDLNEAKDNLWFTLLFKYQEIIESDDKEFQELLSIFYQAMLNGSPLNTLQYSKVKRLIHSKRNQQLHFLTETAKTLLLAHQRLSANKRWGWKEPNTHIILNRLIENIPNMKYIHVVRNGLDIAHSKNQNQQLLWGKYFFGDSFTINPYYSLKYWCFVHKRILEISQPLGNNFLLLNFDKFCRNPEEEIPKLLKFLDVPNMPVNEEKIKTLIIKPKTIGRYKQFGIDIFDKKDVEYVRHLGFQF